MRFFTHSARGTMKVLLLLLASATAAQAAIVTVACGQQQEFPGGTGSATFTCDAINPGANEIGAIYLNFVGAFSNGFPGPHQSVSFTVGSVALGIPPRPIPALVGVLSANTGLVNIGGFYFLTNPGTPSSFAVEVTSVANTSSVDLSQANVFATYCVAPSIPSPVCPVLPSLGGSGNWTFSGQSGLWFDPPATSSYEYTGTGGTTFTSITLVTGFGAVNVQYGPGFASSLGSFAGGSTVDFVALTGGPLSAFRISGINPSVDAADPNAYPLQVFFSSANGTFTQNAVPEPATYSLVIAGAVLAGLLKAKGQALRG